MEFEACDRRRCVDVEIIDNCEMEDTEEFYVTLLRNGLDLDDVEILDSRTTIEITDGDGINHCDYIPKSFCLFLSSC